MIAELSQVDEVSIVTLHGIVRGAYRRMVTGTAIDGPEGRELLEAAATAHRTLEALGARAGFSSQYYRAAHMLCRMLLRAGDYQGASRVIDAAFENGVARFPDTKINLLLERIQQLHLSGQRDAAFELASELVARPFLMFDSNQIAELNIVFGRLCKETGHLEAFRPVMWRGLRVTRRNPELRNRTLDSLVEVFGSREAVNAMAEPGSIEEAVLHFAVADLADRVDEFFEQANYAGPRAQHQVYFGGAAQRAGAGHRILVTRGLGGLGDILMMTPGIRALRGLNPESEIVFAIPGNLLPLLKGNPHCTVVDIAANTFDAREFDAWYNLSDCPGTRHEIRTAPQVTKSRIELFAEGMGIDSEALTRFGRRPVYVVSEEERQFAAEFLLQQGPGPFFAVQLKAADSYRDYDHLETVVKMLAGHGRVLVFHEQPFSGFSYDRVTRVHGLDLRRAFAVVSQCDAVLAPDSSFVHLAGALDLPCVALFGPIDGRMRTQDYPHCITLDASAVHVCMPCWRNEFTKCSVTDGPRSQCMADIDPQRVVKTILNLKEIGTMSTLTAEATKVRKLEIGSGNRPTEGYEHLDFDPNLPHLEYCADFRNLDFLENDTFDQILSVHCIEHIPWREIKKTVAEWVRVLKPGGKIRIATPSLRFICEAYTSDSDSWKKDYDIMTPDEQAHLQIDGVPNKALWANFKLFSSSAGFDNHYACLTGENLVAYLKEGGCSSARITADVDSLVVDAIK
jgi:predicted SAM-dependent methyltransferase